MVPDSHIDRCLEILQQAPDRIGGAKERSEQARHMLKHIEALEMKKWNEGSAAAQTREARASQAYKDALIEDAIAAGELEKIRAEIGAAETLISVWQTQQKAFRGPRP